MRRQQQQWRRRQQGDVSTGTDNESADQTQDWSKERIGFELILRKRISNPTIIIVLLLLLLPPLLPLLLFIRYHRQPTTMWPDRWFRRCRCVTPCRCKTVRTVVLLLLLLLRARRDRGSIVDEILVLITSLPLSLPRGRSTHRRISTLRLLRVPTSFLSFIDFRPKGAFIIFLYMIDLLTWDYELQHISRFWISYEEE